MKKVLFVFILFFAVLPTLVLADQININSATLSQLDEIAHVGDKTAQKIIDARPFSSVSDLSRVKGIGNGKYLQDIIGQGFACVNCSTQIVKTQNTDTTNQNLTDTTSPATVPAIISQITYPTGIFLNEFMPNPKGPDETDEWIKLFNSNNFDVDLSGWKIEDTQGTPTIFTIPQNTKIPANNFLVFVRPETKIMLNNDADGLSLLTPDNKIVDSVSYTNAPLDQTYIKIKSGSWAWSGAKTSLPKTQKSDNSKIVEVATANVSQTDNPVKSPAGDNGASPWFLFYSVLAITIILASVILFARIKFKNLNI